MYMYHTAGGKAALCKGDAHKPVALGKFKSEAEALAACKAHYAKVCQALRNFDKGEPGAVFL